MNSLHRTGAALGITILLAAVACHGDRRKPSTGDLVSRSATGDLAAYGGARRIHGDALQNVHEAVDSSPARNVILFIGDGMGDSEITIARNYAAGAGGSLPGLDALPLTGQYTHFSLDEDGKPNYVADSAASASGWSTGTKTYNGALAVDITGTPQQTLLEIAKAQGRATGDISTAEIQDSTPAALYAHVIDRQCYGPEETAQRCPKNALGNGGAGSITEQLLATRPDVTLGGGLQTFPQVATAGQHQGKTLEVQAKERGYQIVRTTTELNKISHADQDTPLLGLFAEGNMPLQWEGSTAARQGYLQPAERCANNADRPADTPSLADMTAKAIDLLNGSKDGFFLQVEGASIDKQDHSANPCAQIGETVGLDEAVQKALAFAQRDANTLVIVTADHAQTSQIVDNYSEEQLQRIADAKKVPVERVRDAVYPGLTRKLLTKDGAEMTVSYGTSEDVEIEKETHTGSQVRVAAFGPHAAKVVGLTDQTDLFFTMADALGLRLAR